MEKILIICAHPDDEVLGCGGTLLKHKKLKDQINILFVFEGSSAKNKNNINELNLNLRKREKSAIKVAKFLKSNSIKFLNNENLNSSPDNKLKITNEITKHIEEIKPETIYTHSSKDLNIDHRTCIESVLIATRVNKKPVKKILSFEIPSSTEWSFNLYGTFAPNYYVKIDEFINLINFLNTFI